MRRLNYERKDLGYSFALATAVMVAAALVLGLIFGNASGGWKFWLMQGLYTALIGGSAFLYAAISKTNVFAATTLNKPPKATHALWGCAAVLCLVFSMNQVNDLFLDLFELVGLNRPSVEIEQNLAGLLICACILPAFAEEVVFRGTVAQSLANGKSKLGALAISGALFALFHGNPAQTLHQFVLGALLTLLAFRSGSLWTSVIAHFFNNALVVALSYTPLNSNEFWDLQSNLKWALPLMIAGLVGFALCVFGYVKTTKSSWQTEQTNEAEKDKEKDLKALNNAKTSNTMLIIAIFVCAVLWVAQLLLKE